MNQKPEYSDQESNQRAIQLHQDEGVLRRETPSTTTNYLLSVSSSIPVRLLPLFEMHTTHLDKVSNGTRHPFRQNLHWMQRLNEALMLDQVYDVLHITAEMGIVWKGRLHRMIKRNKATTYRTVDELVGIGLLQGVSHEHKEAKAILHLEKLRVPTFSKKQISSMYTIAEEYLDAVSKLLRDPSVEACIGDTTKENTAQAMKSLVHVREQQAKMREAQSQGRRNKLLNTPISRIDHNLDLEEQRDWYKVRDLRVPEHITNAIQRMNTRRNNQ